MSNLHRRILSEEASKDSLSRLADASSEELQVELVSITAQIVFIFPKWKNLPIRRFHIFVDTTFIVELVGGFNRLILAQQDSGILKYDPSAASLLHRLIFLVELKEKVMHHLASSLRPTDTLDSRQKLRDQVERFSSELGVNAAIESARTDLSEFHRIVGGLRRLGRQLRLGAVTEESTDEDHETERLELSAILSTRYQE